MTKKQANQYDSGSYDYLKYWDGRAYEHAAEEMAIKRLLQGRYFNSAADIGGGFGRMSVLLKKYADKVTLVEPAKAQLDIAEDFLKNHSGIEKKLMQANDLKFPDHSIGLITMIRVMHHLPKPKPELKEIHRVLADDGVFILEIANYAHARNRIKHILKRKRLPKKPVDIRSEENKREDEVPFVNHNPKTVVKQLDKIGFKIDRVLSVSNLRSPRLKKLLPSKLMLTVEYIMQPAVSRTYFGPSIFFLLKKK